MMIDGRVDKPITRWGENPSYTPSYDAESEWYNDLRKHMADPEKQDQETQDLSTLLREISELAPEVVDFRGGLIPEMRIGSFGHYPQIDLGKPVPQWYRAIIQAALQSAIEDRGWLYDTGLLATGDYDAHIFDGQEEYSVRANDPTTALAKTFLKALKS